MDLNSLPTRLLKDSLNSESELSHSRRALAPRELAGRTGAESIMCVICLEADTSPAPIQSGCACRGEAGLAHVGCRGRAAEVRARDRDYAGCWQCQTCKQGFTGEMRWGLADAPALQKFTSFR